tara:strand:- start:651 stop:1466 length:816 start_codon:yes stop_codon:yes gene_type:complete
MTTKIPVELSSTPGISDSSDATAITITSDEKVGIGTSSPAQKLDVSGYIKTTRIGAGISPIVPCEILSTGTTSTALRVLKSGSDDSTQNNLFSVTEISGHGRLSIHDSAQNEEIRFDSNGVSYLSDGLSFDGTTTAANALDDYEEGTWTPTFAGVAAAAIYGAHYTKIGQLVMVEAYIAGATQNNSDQFRIGALPFTSKNQTAYGGGSIGYTYASDFTEFGAPIIPGNSSYIYFHRIDGASGVSSIVNSYIYNKVSGGNQLILFQGIYRAD